MFPKSGNGGYDVSDYDLRLNYSPRTDRLRAAARIKATVETPGPPLRRFNLDYRGPKIKSLEVDGRRADRRRNGQELIVTPTGAARERRRVPGQGASTPGSRGS